MTHRYWPFLFVLVVALTMQESILAQKTAGRTFTAFELENPSEPNPMLALLPAGAQPNWDYWRAKMAHDAAKLKSSQLPVGMLAFAASEAEGAGTAGVNDTQGTAQLLTGFGTGIGDDGTVTFAGNLAPAVTSAGTLTNKEQASSQEDGSITDTGTLPGLASGARVTVNGEIGDGAFASTTGDVDFYEMAGLQSGDFILIDVDTPSGNLDSVIGLYSSTGTLIAFNDDDGSSVDSFIAATISGTGTFSVFVAVAGFRTGSPFPSDPFDASTAGGTGSTGPYTIDFQINGRDRDFFEFDLDAGDVLGLSVSGAGGTVNFYDPSGLLMIGSSQNASSAYPSSSTLGSAGNAHASIVAGTTGRYAVEVLSPSGSTGAYTFTLNGFRPPQEANSRTQRLCVDFSGPTINPRTLFGQGFNADVAMSPLSAFLTAWGLTASDEDDVIDAILASLEENLKSDLTNVPASGAANVEILNSRDNPGCFPAANTSRLIVGGTIAEVNISTIGLAQSIDVGNFETQETGFTLLDLLSGPSSNANSLLRFLPGTPTRENRIAVIGAGVGNITAHEAGHFLGNFHTDQFNSTSSLMDQGGNLANTTGVGSDQIIGTADDVDVDFVPDTFVSSEGFTGTEDQQTITAWALFDGGGTLPVELIEFIATTDETAILLSWQTASEVNNAGFQVELRAAGQGEPFEPVGFVQGAGSTLEAQRYAATVEDLMPGEYAVRLRQIDFDGRFAYSEELNVTVELPEAYQLSALYPNPFVAEAQFELLLKVGQEVEVAAYDVLGREVTVLSDAYLGGDTRHTFVLDGSGLASGTYIVKVVGETFQAVRTATLLR